MNPEKMTPEELERLIHRELRGLPARQAPAGFEQRFQAALAARQAPATASPAQLEQLVHRELRNLPHRPAPRDLEARVFAAIERRAALPWYRKSWSYWPASVRAAFLTVLVGLKVAFLTGITLAARSPETAALTKQVDEGFQGFNRLLALGEWVVKFGSRLVADIPPLWLYGGLATVVAFYVMFFGLGAVAYRTLYQHD